MAPIVKYGLPDGIMVETSGYSLARPKAVRFQLGWRSTQSWKQDGPARVNLAFHDRFEKKKKKKKKRATNLEIIGTG